MSLDHRIFAGQLPALVSAGYRVLTWDVRRHGATRPFNGQITIRGVADDLLTLLPSVSPRGVQRHRPQDREKVR